MSEKTQKILKYVSWGLIAVGAAGAIILGATTEEINGGVVLIGGVITAIGVAVKYFIDKIG